MHHRWPQIRVFINAHGQQQVPSGRAAAKHFARGKPETVFNFGQNTGSVQPAGPTGGDQDQFLSGNLFSAGSDDGIKLCLTRKTNVPSRCECMENDRAVALS